MGEIAYVSSDGELISSGGDALALIYEPGSADATWIAVPVSRLDAAFFDLSSGIAGEIVQKFVNYRSRLAVIGDISPQLEASSALSDFVRESNRGDRIWFVNDRAELEARLAER
jgi:hypothetical protein